MRISLAVGIVMFAGKVGAWWFTGSAAILSDASESVVHVVAVAFAAFSLRLSLRPATDKYPYGFERVNFFSAGFEGAMIVFAAVTIIVTAIRNWIGGLELQNLGAGTLVIGIAGVVNGGLGWYLIRTGQRTNSLILVANGKHVLTDCWTSLGVVVGLALVILTGWKPLDPLCALAVAANILVSGSRLMRDSVAGLMDYSDPKLADHIRARLEEFGLQFHDLRCRSTGRRILVQVHLLFPYRVPIGEAHRLATELEDRLADALEYPVEVTTHLEALEDHSQVHPPGSSAGRPD
jgi:cation diffusion facilitator family transporter